MLSEWRSLGKAAAAAARVTAEKAPLHAEDSGSTSGVFFAEQKR
jgi:hypothetical protein